MTDAENTAPIATMNPSDTVHLLVPATELSVREALISMGTSLCQMDVNLDVRGVAEILLAEVLNNIVEHAYAGKPNGMIAIDIAPDAAILSFQVRDWGAAMPGLNVPDAKEHDLDVAMSDLPEGGFGWFMIHTLAENLAYERNDLQNTLSFTLSRAPET